jgi:hypothetical protein
MSSPPPKIISLHHIFTRQNRGLLGGTILAKYRVELQRWHITPSKKSDDWDQPAAIPADKINPERPGTSWLLFPRFERVLDRFLEYIYYAVLYNFIVKISKE